MAAAAALRCGKGVAAKAAAKATSMESEVRDAMNDCLVVQSGGCHSAVDGMCPKYLAKKKWRSPPGSPTCENFLKFVYPDKFPDVDYTDVKWNAWSDHNGYYRSLFDSRKQDLCKQPLYMNSEFCSCLARGNADSIWNKGGEDIVGFQTLFDNLFDGSPVDQDQCWYKNCNIPSQKGYLNGGSPTIMTIGSLTQDKSLGGKECTDYTKCRVDMSAIGNAKIAANMTVNCGGSKSKKTPDAPSQSRNVILILAAVLVPLVLLVLLFRRLLR